MTTLQAKLENKYAMKADFKKAIAKKKGTSGKSSVVDYRKLRAGDDVVVGGKK